MSRLGEEDDIAPQLSGGVHNVADKGDVVHELLSRDAPDLSHQPILADEAVGGGYDVKRLRI